MTPSGIITEARDLLNDTLVPYRYTDAMLLRYVNQTIKRMVILRPDLFGELGELTTTAGTTVQELPVDAYRLIDIFQVKNGGAITEVDRETLSRNYPGWMAEEAGTPVNFMRHVKNPDRYFLYPAPATGTILIGEYVKTPADYAIGAEITPLADAYKGVVIDGVLFLASSMDDEHVTSGRAQLFVESFMKQLGIGLTSRPVTDDKSSGTAQPHRADVKFTSEVI